MVTGLGTLLCEVNDMDRAVEFYRDVLGLRPIVVSEHWSSFRIGPATIGLHPPMHAGPKNGGWILGIETADLTEFRAKLNSQGVATSEFHPVPDGMTMDFSDPDGNRLQAIERAS